MRASSSITHQRMRHHYKEEREAIDAEREQMRALCDLFTEADASERELESALESAGDDIYMYALVHASRREETRERLHADAMRYSIGATYRECSDGSLSIDSAREPRPHFTADVQYTEPGLLTFNAET